MMVEKCVLLELKAVRSLDTAYLRATEIEVGMLFNFGLKPQFKRMAYDNSRKARASKVDESILDSLLKDDGS